MDLLMSLIKYSHDLMSFFFEGSSLGHFW